MSSRSWASAVALGLAVLLAAGRTAQAQYGPNPGQVVGGFLGLMGDMARQAQQQQQLQQRQQQIQQQQFERQQQQQQIEIERQREAAEAQERARERRQAEAESAARQKAAAARSAAEAKAKADALERQARAKASKLRSDPAFLVLLGPDNRDITVLVVGQDTQNVVRNLKGEPVFQKGANACLPFGALSAAPDSLEARFLVDVKGRIEKTGGLTDSSLMLTACDLRDAAQYDLILFSREQISNGSPDPLAPLLDLIHKRTFVAYKTFAIADFEAAEAAKTAAAHAEQFKEAAERQAAVKDFQSRDPNIISAIHLTAPDPAPVACILASDPDGIHYLLKRSDSPFATTVTAATAFRDLASSDAIFIALKRQECAAAVAPAGVLREVVAGLNRDNVSFEVDPGEIDTSRLANWKVLQAADLAAAQEQQKRDAEAQRRKDTAKAAEEEVNRRLAEQRERNDEASRREALERMRKLVVSKANAVVDMIAQKLRKHMASVAEEINATKQRIALGRVLSSEEEAKLNVKYAAERIDFPPWTEEFLLLVKEGWEFDDIKPSVEDYGRAQWRGRTIEAIAVRVEFPMINRVIGAKKTGCYDFIWINDEEFRFMRQMKATACDRYEAEFADWAQSNGFVSQWKLLQN